MRVESQAGKLGWLLMLMRTTRSVTGDWLVGGVVRPASKQEGCGYPGRCATKYRAENKPQVDFPSVSFPGFIAHEHACSADATQQWGNNVDEKVGWV